MAGFNDIAQALQFGAGLVHGFQKQTDDMRAQHDTQQLELLKLLSHDDTKSVTPVDPGEVVGTQGFFGGGTLKTKEGHPAFKVGGNIFAVRPRPALGGGDDTEVSPGVPAASTAPPQPKALPSYNPYGPTPEAPAAPAPVAPGGLETTAPDAPPATGTQKTIASATQAHAALDTETRERIHSAVRTEIAKHPNVSFEEALGIIGVESHFNPTIKSSKGAVGLMQLMPNTAAKLGVKDSENIEENIRGGIQYYSRLKDKYKNNQELALAAYNSGEGRVDKLGRVPNIPETQDYVKAVPGVAESFRPKPPTQQASAQPDMSMMVAGDNTAPAPQGTELPPADTIQQRQHDASAKVLKQYKGAQTRAEMKEYRTADKEARDKVETRYGQELREVEKDVETLRKRTHDPRVLDLLDGVKTYNQFEHVKGVIKASPEQDYIAQATDYLSAAVKAGSGDEAARKVRAQLLRQNYPESEVTATLKAAGYDDVKKLALLRKEQEQKQDLENKNVPARQAAELPGQMALEKQKASILKPNEADVPAINAEMQHDIQAGKVPADITMSDYLKRNPELMVSVQKKREAGKPETETGKNLQEIQRLEAKTGRTPDEEEALRALRGKQENAGLSAEESTRRAVEKKTQMDEATATAKNQRIGKAQDDVNKLLSGETPPPAGMDKHTAAIQRLRQDNLKPSDISTAFANEVDEHKPFTKLPDRQGWVTPDYMQPPIESKADAKDKGAIQLSKEEAPRFGLGNELHAKLQRIDDNMKKLAEIDPTWKTLSAQQGLPNRMKIGAYQLLRKTTQDNPTTAAFMKAIDNDLKEIGINYGRFITGMQGRPAQKLIELSTQNLPNADTTLVGWLSGKGKLSDNPATMLTQLGLMKDMIRTVQDDVLMEHGGITLAEKSKRADKRLDDLAHPERAKATASSATPAVTSPPPAAAAAPAPVKSKGETEADAYMSGGKP